MEAAATPEVQALPMSSMSSSKRIVDVNVAQLRQRFAEFGDLIFLRFDLLTIRTDAFAFFFHVEAQILQQDDRARSWILARLFDFGSNAVVEELDVPAIASAKLRAYFWKITRTYLFNFVFKTSTTGFNESFSFL